MPIRSLPSESAERPSKKRKLSATKGITSKTIAALESQLTSAVLPDSNSNSTTTLNPLVDLYTVALNVGISAADTSKAIWALYRVWVVVIGSGKMRGGKNEDENVKVVTAWLWERLNEYVELLCGLLKDEEKVLRTSSLQILFSLQKHLSSSVSSKGDSQFHISHFRKIVNALVACLPSHRTTEKEKQKDGLIDADVLDLFCDKWLCVYDDVRWFFLREIGTLLSKKDQQPHPFVPTNTLSILERLAGSSSTSSFLTTTSSLERPAKDGKQDNEGKQGQWWVEEMGKKPPKVKKGKGADLDADADDEEEDKIDKEDDEEDDWRKFFDEQNTNRESNTKKDNLGERIKGRKHTLTLHQSLHNTPSHRAAFTHAWLALLSRLSGYSSKNNDVDVEDVEDTKDLELAVRALNVMHRGVLPYLTRPVLVMDWIGACVDYGGTPGLLALNALYVLMTEYNLDYPSFYTRLYAFLDRDLLHVKHRARFFRLAEVFLGSTHLPLTLLASFIKRLSILSLSAPPSAIVIVIPFVWNLVRRHPGLMGMIHREWDGQGVYEDPFLPSHPNPLLTNALSSSLFELHAHTAHYHAPVSSMAKVFEGVFTRGEYAMEDFLDHGYASLFDAEVNRKIKKEPAMNMELELEIESGLGGVVLGTKKKRKREAALFGFGREREQTEGGENEEEGDDGGGDESIGRDIVTELWVF
ncbi:CBF-domain-containing protein [Lentinula edodes]|nr:CBF-domain-containing protein [Lentinula edodes]